MKNNRSKSWPGKGPPAGFRVHPHLIYRALKFANASGLCLPFSRLLILTLSALACRGAIPPPFCMPVIGVDVPLELLLKKGLRLPWPPAECMVDAGMVALRLVGVKEELPNISPEGAGEMACAGGTGAWEGSGIDARP